MDITIPDDDQPNVRARKAFRFDRSMRGDVGRGGAQRPLNTLTSALDLDAVYAANSERNINALRGLDSNGEVSALLKTSANNLLPLNTDGFVNSPDISNKFFIAGDHRANEHPALTAFHTIFLREHNRLVKDIQNRVGTSVTQVVYDAARAMNIAQFQKIIFEEFYPAAVGSMLPPYTGFNPDVDPTVSDIFSGAAFRFGHTMVSNTIPRRDAGNERLSSVPMADIFFRPASKFSSTFMEDILRGIAHEMAQEVDIFVVDALRNQLFENVAGEEGFDLISINLQRSRDHALPSFNRVRQLFGLSAVRKFSEINDKKDVAERLSRAYRGMIDDVELFVGLLAEDHVPGSTFGRTMNAIWKREFARLRDGDQFHYLLTNKLPLLLQNHFEDWIKKLRTSDGITLKEIIVKNSLITNGQLPKNIFKLSTVKPSQPKPTTASPPSPTLNGVCTPRVCCLQSCGECGGPGCSRRRGGDSGCCVTAIMMSGRVCGSDTPPCVLPITPPEEKLCSSSVCCAISCGSCGGKGCSSRRGGEKSCCISAIKGSGRQCRSSTPPCII